MGQRHAKQPGDQLGVIVEGLVEIAQPVEQDGIGAGGLQLAILHIPFIEIEVGEFLIKPRAQLPTNLALLGVALTRAHRLSLRSLVTTRNVLAIIAWGSGIAQVFVPKSVIADLYREYD